MASPDPRLVNLLGDRDFGDDIYIEDDDLVLDVMILARVVRPEAVGTGESGLVIISEVQTDGLMQTGMLQRAAFIDQSATYINNDEDED